ncbi:MAG: hypothetical protein FJW35_01945 [Acidobacteria bacterium]|nr:hypothetical protein [Acidobacteriota bacterium]
MRDGVRLAVDVIRPERSGQVAEERLPVVWSHTRYRRAFGQCRLGARRRPRHDHSQCRHRPG